MPRTQWNTKHDSLQPTETSPNQLHLCYNVLRKVPLSSEDECSISLTFRSLVGLQSWWSDRRQGLAPGSRPMYATSIFDNLRFDNLIHFQSFKSWSTWYWNLHQKSSVVRSVASQSAKADSAPVNFVEQRKIYDAEVCDPPSNPPCSLFVSLFKWQRS